MDKYNFFKKGGLRPSEEQLLDTKLFFCHANEVYARFEDWKDIDKFYFIPLYMEMTYSCSGWVAEMAPDPVWLGSFVRCTLDHPDLFQYQCPRCGKSVFPFRYVGSPLSGRVDLEGYCDCGWKGYKLVSGWFVRGEALRNQLDKDKFRYEKYKFLHHGAEPSSCKDLLEFIGLPLDM